MKRYNMSTEILKLNTQQRYLPPKYNKNHFMFNNLFTKLTNLVSKPHAVLVDKYLRMTVSSKDYNITIVF
jgi:hypothetical protein